MRYVRDVTGRFAERPHYEPDELDSIFEPIVCGFLRSRYGRLSFPLSTADLTVLLEEHTEDLDSFADLESYGQGVEGVTEFRNGHAPCVKISKALAQSAAHENRLRTTLAHEFGHVHLHGPLFALKADQLGLFDGDQPSGIIACKRDTMISAPKTDWLEWQAGYASGALLMPASQVRGAIESYRHDARLFGPVPLSTPAAHKMIDLIVSQFLVSREAARVRMIVLGLLGNEPTTGALPF